MDAPQVDAVAAAYRAARTHLDERQRRILLGTAAERLGPGATSVLARATGTSRRTIARGAQDAAERPGPGATSALARATGVSRRTIARGVQDATGPPGGRTSALDGRAERRAAAPAEGRAEAPGHSAAGRSQTPIAPADDRVPASAHHAQDRIRAPGAGRPRLTELDATLASALAAPVGPRHRDGTPGPLLWTVKSTRTLAQDLARMGHPVSASTVARMLREAGFNLMGRRMPSGQGGRPDPATQFEHVNDLAATRLAVDAPVVAVRARRLVGQVPDPMRPDGPPDVPFALGSTLPGAVLSAGWSESRADRDTSEFAVEALSAWWRSLGRVRWPDASKLLVCADGGASRHQWAWKSGLARFAAEAALEVEVAHVPPGTLKWICVGHRTVAFRAAGWPSGPPVSHRADLGLIGPDALEPGLAVRSDFDSRPSPAPEPHTRAQLAALPLVHDALNGDWNYVVRPDVTALPGC
jgi:hypothetical protein